MWVKDCLARIRNMFVDKYVLRGRTARTRCRGQVSDRIQAQCLPVSWISRLGLITCLSLMGYQPIQAAHPLENQAQSEEILMQLNEGLSVEQGQAYLSTRGLQTRAYYPEIDVWSVAAVGVNRTAALSMLASDRQQVDWAEPNGLVRAFEWIPNDPLYQVEQSYLSGLAFQDAWVFARGEGITIAVLDTGIDLDHADLMGQIWSNPQEIAGNGLDDDGNSYVDDVLGWDFVNADDDPQDDFGHGSHVSGTAAASTNNAVGIAGVAGGGRLMPVKVLDRTGNGSWEDVSAGLIYAANQGAQVINLSLGGVSYSQTLAAAVVYAQQCGSLIVAAAGNESSPVNYPAALPGVVAVTATYGLDFPWASSNFGPEVDVAAPGVNITSTNHLGGYKSSSGTSMAAPHVSGLAALLWSLDPDLTASQVSSLILANARDIYTSGWDDRTGWGQIDPPAAVYDLVQPQISLSMEHPSVHISQGAVLLTATVHDRAGQPVPDGVRVAFRAETGEVSPASALTFNGQASTWFLPNQTGQVTVSAHVGDIRNDLRVEVNPWLFFIPALINN